MSATWYSDNTPDPQPIGPMGWVRIVVRGVPLGVVTFGCLGLLLLVRLVERPIFGANRPVTPHITQFVCRSAFVLMGIRHVTVGQPMSRPGAAVSNHVGWLDIFSLNAPQRIYYVSKSEVAGWPGIGWLARATGTLFIKRDRKEAAAQTRVLEDRLKAGHRLLFFPEGTSTDGLRVLDFKTTLFQPFMADGLRQSIWVQPVTLRYTAPPGQDPRVYGWWGDMEFGAHLLQILAAPKQGMVEVIFHDPLRVADFADRKALAAACETTVRAGLAMALDGSKDHPQD